MMQRTLDAAGLGLSALCIAHCLALPLAAASAPLAAQLAEAEWVHGALVALAAPAAFAAIAPGRAQRPLTWTIPALAGLGLTLLTAALAAPLAWETGLSVTGGLTLALAHILNWRRAHAHV